MYWTRRLVAAALIRNGSCRADPNLIIEVPQLVTSTGRRFAFRFLSCQLPHIASNPVASFDGSLRIVLETLAHRAPQVQFAAASLSGDEHSLHRRKALAVAASLGHEFHYNCLPLDASVADIGSAALYDGALVSELAVTDALAVVPDSDALPPKRERSLMESQRRSPRLPLSEPGADSRKKTKDQIEILNMFNNQQK
jgi:hypothetical protein